MNRKTFALVTLVLVAVASPVHAQRYTTQGAAVGGVTGAVIGGLIGKQTDKTTGGALIGGAVGAVAGGMMGRNYDNQMSRQRYAHQQAMYSQQQQFYTQQQATAQSGVSIADVLSMSRTGVSDSVIMSQMQARGIQRRLEVSDIISLHQQGISDTVISAMQAAPLASNLPQNIPAYSNRTYGSPVIVQPQPVIVHEQPVIYERHYRTYQSHRW
jgi:outer membrane lipoprotein SlyB